MSLLGAITTKTTRAQQSLRDHNLRAVLDLIAAGYPLSRVRIAEKLQLSQASVSRIVDWLLRAGIVVEGDRAPSMGGRPRTLLGFNGNAGYVAGVDIRSRKTRLVIADLNGKLVLKHEVPTGASSTEQLANTVAEALLSTLSSTGSCSEIVTAAVGISGAWDQRRRSAYAIPNIPILDKVDLVSLLEPRFGCQVLVDNDVNYAALGEMAHGAAKHAQDFVYFNLGSGIGGSAVIGGQLHRGVQGFAGELGYLPIATPDGYVPLEKVASRVALTPIAKSLGLGEDAIDIFERAESGNLAALDMVEQLADCVSVALEAVIVTFNPALIVIGGSMGRRSDMLIPLLEQRIMHALCLCPTIVPTQLREDAPLLGAVVAARTEARTILVDREQGRIKRAQAW